MSAVTTSAGDLGVKTLTNRHKISSSSSQAATTATCDERLRSIAPAAPDIWAEFQDRSNPLIPKVPSVRGARELTQRTTWSWKAQSPSSPLTGRARPMVPPTPPQPHQRPRIALAVCNQEHRLRPSLLKPKNQRLGVLVPSSKIHDQEIGVEPLESEFSDLVGRNDNTLKTEFDRNSPSIRSPSDLRIFNDQDQR